MEINFNKWFLIFAVVWIGLCVIGAFLIYYVRKDGDKYVQDAQFIFSKGTFWHKLTYVLLCLLILPLSIVTSLKKINDEK